MRGATVEGEGNAGLVTIGYYRFLWVTNELLWVTEGDYGLLKSDPAVAVAVGGEVESCHFRRFLNFDF